MGALVSWSDAGARVEALFETGDVVRIRQLYGRSGAASSHFTTGAGCIEIDVCMELGTIDRSAAEWILKSAREELSVPLAFSLTTGDRIPAEQMFVLWQALDELDDGTLGARMAGHVSSDLLSQRVMFSLASQEPVAHQALSVIAKNWGLLSSQSELEVVRDPENHTVSIKIIHAIVGIGPVASQLTLLVLKRALNRLFGADAEFVCLEMRMPVPRKAKAKLEQMVSAPVLQGQNCDAVVYRDRVLTRAVDFKAAGVPHSVHEMMAHLKLEPEPTFSAKVAKEIQNHLPNTPTIEAISNHMDIEVRSLQRRLKAEQNSFRRVCLETRMRIAKACLLAGGSVEDVALLCAYQNPISFSNAFVRAVGVSPGRFRTLNMSREV